MRTNKILLAVALAVSLAACGDDTSTSSEPAPDWHPSANTLNDALLPISVMPTGWSQTSSGGDSGGGTGCGQTIQEIVGEETPGARTTYSKSDSIGPFVSLIVSVLPPAANPDAMETLRESIGNCEWSEDDVTYTTSQMSYPTVGDESFAIRMVATERGSSFTTDVVYVRSGDIFTAVAAGLLVGDTIELLDEYVPAQLKRAIETLS